MDFSGLLGDGAVALGCAIAAVLVVSGLAPAGRRLAPALAAAVVAALVGGGSSLAMRAMAPRAEAADPELDTADGRALKRYFPTDYAILANVQRQAVADGKTSLERTNARRGVMVEVLRRQAPLVDDARAMELLRFTIKAATEMERSAPDHCVEYLSGSQRVLTLTDEDLLPGPLLEEGRETTADMLEQTATHPVATPALKNFQGVGEALIRRAARDAGKDVVREYVSAGPASIQGPAQCRFQVAFLKEMVSLPQQERLAFLKALFAVGAKS